MTQHLQPEKRGTQVVDALYEAVRTMPKIELHRHLEGSLRLSTLVDIADECGVDLPQHEIEAIRPLVQVMPYEANTMDNFLGKFTALRQFFRTKGIVTRITREAVIDAADDNVKYLELRFTPKALCNLSGCETHEIVELVCETAMNTAADHDITVRLIVSPNRHETVEDAMEAAEAAIAYQHMGVVALDLGGKEPGCSVYPFREVFRRARAAGLHITVHAGEWAGPESVWDAMTSVQPERIGHGIQALQDPGVISVLLDRGTVLEVCPSSNVETGAQASMRRHPLPQLIHSGLKVTINTDDPLVFNIALTDELVRAVRYMSLTFEDIKQHTLLAAESVFLPDSEKVGLIRRFKDWLEPL